MIFDVFTWIVYLCALYLSVFWLLVLLANMRLIKNSDEGTENLPKVSVVVPAYNEEEIVAESIKSLKDLDYPKDLLEIIVVNDGSKDNTKAICEKIEGIKLINLEKNSGTKAIPLNIGLREATGEIVACLDADSVVDPKALKRMMPYFSDPRVVAVTPALKVYKPANLIQKLQWYEYIFAVFLRKLMSLIDSIYVTPGPFTLFRRDVLMSLGGFDEKNITEDMEIALKLQQNDYKIKNAIDADVYTKAPEDLKTLYKQRRRWYYGLIHNSIKYKKLFFNTQYGDFGILMPLHMLSAIVLVISTVLFWYYLLNPIIDEVNGLMLIGFDLPVYLRNLHFDFIFLDLDYTKVFVALFVLILGTLTLVLSHRFSKERIMKYGLPAVLVFMFFYFIFLGCIWMGVILELASGTKRRW